MGASEVRVGWLIEWGQDWFIVLDLGPRGVSKKGNHRHVGG